MSFQQIVKESSLFFAKRIRNSNKTLNKNSLLFPTPESPKTMILINPSAAGSLIIFVVVLIPKNDDTVDCVLDNLLDIVLWNCIAIVFIIFFFFPEISGFVHFQKSRDFSD
jgi:hypothetical protein